MHEQLWIKTQHHGTWKCSCAEGPGSFRRKLRFRQMLRVRTSCKKGEALFAIEICENCEIEPLNFAR